MLTDKQSQPQTDIAESNTTVATLRCAGAKMFPFSSIPQRSIPLLSSTSGLCALRLTA